MLVTLLGIETDSNPEQPANALLPMLVTLSLMVTLSSDDLPFKRAAIVLQSKTASFILLQPEKTSEPKLVGLH